MLPCINDSLGDDDIFDDDVDDGGEHDDDDDDGGDLQRQTVALLQTRLDRTHSLVYFG